MARILIVDDDPTLRRALVERLRFWEHDVEEAATVRAGAEAVRARRFDVVLLDLELPDGSGLDLLQGMRGDEETLASAPDVVVLTAHGSIEAAVVAIRAGATDFLLKPTDFELLRAVLDRTLERRRLTSVHRARVERDDENDGELVVASQRMSAVLATAAQAARSKAVILLTGESGTGKQKVAEYVHRKSDRANGPFVYVNCVAVNDEMIESTLFGHEKGAFTGAIARRIGRLETAHDGTAFLDEIGDISPKMQAKLLHFLETGEFERLGGTRTLRVDCRIVAATHRDLPAEIRAGRFREDLYFRLNVIGIHLPPLRERREDIVALTDRFVAHYARDAKRPGMVLDPATRARLEAHDWPGNVRQLKNAIERMVVLAPDEWLTPDLLPVEVAGDTPGAPGSPPDPGTEVTPPAFDLRAAVEAFRREHIAAALARTGGNRTRAAALLGIQRTHLSLLLHRSGPAAPDAEAAEPGD